MSERNDWDAEWDGFEPHGSRAGGSGLRWVMLIGLIVVVCLGGLGLLAWQFLARTASEPPALAAPTAVTVTETAVAEAPPATSPPIAPTATLPGAVSSVTVPRLAAAPSIDASLTDWPDGTAVGSAFQVYSAPSWDGSDDIDADWRLGWDDANLYIFVTVTDDTHVQTQTGNQIFKGDGVSLQIDTQRAADLGAGVSLDDFQINLSPGDFASVPTVAYRFRGTEQGRMSDAPGHQIALAARPSTSGYTLEAAIPWVDLAVRPEAGLVLGVALNVNDNDGVGTAVQEVMKSHVSTRQFSNPASWGTMTLEEG